MKGLIVSIAAAAVLAGGATIDQGVEVGRSCAGEPEPAVNTEAKKTSETDSGSVVTVTVEVSIVSERYVPAARLHGARAGGPGFDEEFGIPDTVLALHEEKKETVAYELDLEPGRVHDLVFSVRSEEGVEPSRESTAYLRINLNPALEPEHLEGLLQYRANMTGN